MEVVAIALAAGRGERLAAGLPKASVEIAGRSLLEWSLRALAAARGIDAVLPVVSAGGGPEQKTSINSMSYNSSEKAQPSK